MHIALRNKNIDRSQGTKSHLAYQEGEIEKHEKNVFVGVGDGGRITQYVGRS